MITTINNENQAARSRRVLVNKGDVFSSFNVEDFIAPHGRDEEWKFTPLCKLRSLHNGTAADPVIASISVEIAGQSGVVVDVVKCDGERLGRAGTPTDRVAAQTYSNSDDAHAATFVKNSTSKEPVVIGIDGPGEDSVSYGHIVIDVQSHVETVCVINYRGSGMFVDNIEFAIGDDAKLSAVTMVNRSEDVVHDSTHRACVGRNVTLRHTVMTLGGEVVHIVPCVAFMAPGGDVDPLGMYFADAGRYFENHMLVDCAVLNRRSNVMYKGALQGEPNVTRREARTAWVGDVPTRVGVMDTDTYEFSCNLLLTEGARVDAVPDLETETGEVAGTGYAVTVSCFDGEQLSYLLSHGILELAARRLVVCDFFSKVINLIPVESICEKLGKLVDEGLNTAGF